MCLKRNKYPGILLIFASCICIAFGLESEKAGKCTDDASNIESIPGTYIPQCQEDGTYHKKQCHGSTGYCWCVDPATGQEINGTRKGPAKGKVNCEAGKCTDHASNIESMPGTYIPQCQDDGTYQKNQCHGTTDGSTGYCFCVDPATGQERDGTRRAPAEVKVNCEVDVEHPLHLNVSVSFRNISISWQAPAQNTSQVEQYTVYYQRDIKMYKRYNCPEDNTMEKVIVASDESSTFSTVIEGLQPGSDYSLCVVAEVKNGTSKSSVVVHRRTPGCGQPGSDAEKYCLCHTKGTNSSRRCDEETCLCICKTKTIIGDNCHKCISGYHWHNSLVYDMCEKCDCPVANSDGTCKADDNGLISCNCTEGFAGPKCKVCATGFYEHKKYPNKCARCECNENEDPSVSVICDRRTGVCQCSFNTTGDHCDKCQEGYSGNPFKQLCFKDPEPPTTSAATTGSNSSMEWSQQHPPLHHLHMATIAGITVGAIGLTVMLITLLCIIRWKKLKRKPFKLWTVELRDDHENVNFSQMMEDETNTPANTPESVQYFERDRQPTALKTSRSNIYKAVRT